MGFFDGLPSGWASAKDAKGVTYYYNRETGENTYTKPSKGGKPVVKKALQLTDGSNPPPGGPPPPGGGGPPPPGGPEGPLPPGWVKTPDGQGGE